MFGNFLTNKYEKYQTNSNGLSKSGFQLLFTEQFNYSLPRQSLATLEKFNIIQIADELNESEGKGKRFSYDIQSVKDALVYLLVCDSIVGMNRGEKAESRFKHFKELKVLSTGSNVGIEFHIRTCDRNNGINTDASTYNPMLPQEVALDIRQQTNTALIFFMHWINGIYTGQNRFDFDFYNEWQIFKSRVLDFNEDRVGNIPLCNKHHMKHSFTPITTLKSVHYPNTRADATIDTSILEVNRFLDSADAKSKLKLQTWFEILLRYDTGTSWLRTEAKAELEKLDLDFSLIIDDLWLLAFIFYNKILIK
ncbi:MAG: hypothetical protein IJ963_00755 [Phascolarctobacterium sp.]|nr:hypothetical protein [Phascolarctobacterium sp.]